VDTVESAMEEYGQLDDARQVQSSERPRGWHTASRHEQPRLTPGLSPLLSIIGQFL
jgi:hypothetical protein